MYIDLYALECFVKVAEMRSLSRAAAVHGLPKSTLSHKSRQLEERFGSSLFGREGRRLVPTDAGIELLAMAKQMMATSDSLIEKMAELRDQVSGTLHLANTGEFGATFIGQLILQFRKKFPRIMIDLVVFEHSTSLSIKRTRGFDAVLSWDEHVKGDTFVRPLASATFGLFASPDFAASAGRLQHTADLQNEKALLYRRGGESAPWRLFRESLFIEIMQRGDYNANDYWAIKYLAFAGQGIACLPKFFTVQECRRGSLQPVLRDWQSELSGSNFRSPKKPSLQEDCGVRRLFEQSLGSILLFDGPNTLFRQYYKLL